MALWQYTFQILSKESVEALSPHRVFNSDDDGFDDELFWKIYPIKKEFFSPIGNFLSKTPSWSKEIDLYGNQESNRFEVFSDNESNVISVSFRIDFRSNYEPILKAIIEFCLLKELIILDENLCVAPLHYELVRDIIENAPQVKKYKELYFKQNNRDN